MGRWPVLMISGLFVLAGACTAYPPDQVPAPAKASTPVTTVTATPSTSAPPPVTVTVSPPKPAKPSTSALKSPWRCEPGYPNCTKAQSQKYLADLEYQKCRRDPEKIWDTHTQKCRYKTSGETQWEHFNGTPLPGTP
ncbi:hypothetical protein [Amycolatopsis alba]|uniref:Lipoprotein n=1 Tax=Amycolatopsis alba DSM 44262 TaxID=1125972 RepID=A0A229R895_AMYAL|nr:hypothetical protein [Amycolatopsis alba]OXM42856.1 hypothetical protein CFP75_41075 [Amycolatopsis alba DSM 44262]